MEKVPMTEKSRTLHLKLKSKPSGVRLTLAALLVTSGFIWLPAAQAQFICAGSADGSTGLGPQGASATGGVNVACGTNANAQGAISTNTALGSNANASG